MNILKRNSKIIDQKYKEFFLPTVLTAISTECSLIVDGIIVSNMLGENEFAAVNTCLPPMQLYTTLASLVGLGGATCISIAKGRRENEKADRTFTFTCGLLLLIGFILLGLQVAFQKQIAGVLAADSVLNPLAYSYYHILLWGTPIIIVVDGMANVVRVEGQVKLASQILLTANIVNLLLDLLFMGVFKMGIEGSALATVLGYAISVPLLCNYLFTSKRTLHILFGKTVETIKEIFNTGCAGALGEILIVFKLLCINNIVVRTVGNQGMVAFSLCVSCVSFVSMFIAGAVEAMLPILGIAYGERDYTSIKYVFKYAAKVLAVFIGALIVVFELFPNVILLLYNVTDPDATTLCVQAIRIFSVSLIGVSMSFLMMYYYMSTEKNMLSNIIAVVEGFVVVVPCAYILTRIMGSNGIWLSFMIAEIVTVIVIFIAVKGNVSNILLLDESDKVIKDISVRTSDAANASEQIIHFLIEYGMDKSRANKAGIAVEEMVENIRRHSGEKTDIDIGLRAEEGKLVIMVTDNGNDFDPTICTEEKQDSMEFDHIKMLQAIATDINYQRVIGLNKTNIILS